MRNEAAAVRIRTLVTSHVTANRRRPVWLALAAGAIVARTGGCRAAASSSAQAVTAPRASTLAAAASSFRPRPTKRCLVRSHEVHVLPLAPFLFRPRPEAHFGFVTRSGDNGYVMFYASAARAKLAAARWDVEHEQLLCTPLGHTLSWCLSHLPVPGIKQTTGNVFIDLISGPKSEATRRLLTGCVR